MPPRGDIFWGCVGRNIYAKKLPEVFLYGLDSL